MSGEIVLAPAIPLVALGVAGAAVAGVAVAGTAVAGFAGIGIVAVNKLVDGRAEAARKSADEEKQRILQWQEFQEKQRVVMQEASRLQESFRLSEEKLRSISLQSVSTDSTAAPVQKREGYLHLGVPHAVVSEKLSGLLNNINLLLIEMPQSFKSEESSPFRNLEKHYQRLSERLNSGKLVTADEMESFLQTITRSFSGFQSMKQKMAEKQQQLFDALETLLDDSLYCRALTAIPRHRESLDSLKAQIVSLITADDVRSGQVELLQKRVAAIKQEVEYETTNAAYRISMAESLSRNLGELGYSMLKPFKDVENEEVSQAVMAIPGGEQVRIAFQKDNRLSFQLSHEKQSDEESVDEDELAFFREQEQQWCQDSQELLRRMRKEGFEYNVMF